jgi:PAS domain S-box-containing protein
MKLAISTVKHGDDDDLFKTLTQALPVGVCIMQDGKLCYVNSTFPIAIGYTVDELVGNDSLELVVPEDREMVKENTVRMLKGELRSPYQFRVTCKDGSVVWVMATVKSIQYRGRRATLGNYMEITERKLMDEAVKESEDKYKELADSITDVFFAMDENLRYTYWNRASEVLTGIRAEDALGRSLREVFPDRPWRIRAEEMYHRVLKTKQLQTFVNDYDINGRHYILEINAYPSRTGISVFVKDVTAHQRTEEARRQAEEEKSALLEEAPVSIVHTDMRGKITYVNQRFESDSGYSRTEVIGKSGFQLDWFPADTLEFLRERMVAILGGSPAKHWETQFKCKDGRWIWIELEGKILRRSGAPIGFQIIATNITERKEAEEALRQSEERYRTILEEMGNGYFETNLAGNFTFVNDAQARLLGYSNEEVIGTNFRAFTPAERVKTVLEAYNRMYKTGEPLRNFVDEVINKDGSHGFAETSAFPIRNDRGEVVGFRGVRRDITARRQMEEALRHSEERYRTILEEMEDAYFEVDLGGHLTFVNNSVCRDLGYSREELMGKSYKAFTVEDDIESLFRVFNEVYRTRVPNKGSPWRTVRKDGTHGFAETSISVLRNDKGEIIGFRGVGRDITERKQTEERLRQSKEHYRALFDNSVTGTLVVDAETMKVVIGNQAAAKMFGLNSAEEGVGVNLLDFVPREGRQKALELVKNELFARNSRRTFDLQAMTKDGRRIWISATGAKITQGDRLAGLLSFADITERKLAEEKLRQSEENYRVLFDNSVIGTIVLDAETFKVVMANQAAARIFDFGSVEQGIGLNPVDFIAPEDKQRVLEVIVKEMFEKDLRLTNEFRAVTKNGRQLWISATGARIMHEGKVAGLISFTDITDQKLQNERLIMTDRLASLGELASGTAHELNNPLTSIIGFSQLLMEREVPDDIREDLRLINTEAQRAAIVTKNLLTFARRHAPMKEPNQINSIIEDVLRLRAYDHRAKGIEVESHFDPRLPEVMVDYFQMQQVFVNLIINAEYFMLNAHNRGTLTVTTKKQDDKVMILFADDGPGIPPDNLGRIFDPFFTTKEAGKGTGLGLSICHGIVTEHGGQIYARSQLGKGATIVVELPVRGESRS